ncbi:restriction endonuclease subunit S [Fodinibius halophilus]|uniref:Restriction endonuclease subunit S n=1 Tax=Fodinibius halophilus TaxID=1736908 RepID=A0A6M1T6H4_9BACT|nr:restriction endonuclease subunit S [Fodinibius halophilus]NGP89689.1 restriction endonuclease subunit S [Fodinibius halophilus]
MKTIELGEIATYQNGYAFKPSDWSDNGLPIIRIQNLNDEKKDFNYYDGDLEKKYFVQDGDVLIAWSASLGIYVWNRGDAWLNQHIFKVIFKSDEVIKLYFVYAVQEILKNIENKLHGSTMKHITKKKFLKLKMPLPCLEEQKRIVAKLNRAQRINKIDVEMRDQYDGLIQSLFLEMFGDPMTNYTEWEEVKIKKLGEIVLGNTPPKKDPENYGDEIEWVKTSNIDKSSIYPSEAEEYLSKKGKELGRVIPEGSLIVCCIAGSLSSIGKCAITDRDIAINQQINAIVPDSEVVDVNYLYTFLLVGQELIQDASTKSMKGMVSKTRFKEIELMLPPLELQKEFSQIFEKIVDEKRKLIMESGKSQELYSSLLQQSFAYE